MILHSEDYYIDPETGRIILTEEYLLKRGYCCNSRCRHCPYVRSDAGATQQSPEFDLE